MVKRVYQTSFLLPSDVCDEEIVVFWEDDEAARGDGGGRLLGGAPAPTALTSAKSLKSSCRTLMGTRWLVSLK
jgi:hypothetical protein